MSVDKQIRLNATSFRNNEDINVNTSRSLNTLCKWELRHKMGSLWHIFSFFVTMRTLHVIVLWISLASLYAWPNFMNDIPNGRKVPNPCTPEEDSWFLVGHQFPTRRSFKRARTLAPPTAAGEPTNKFLNEFGEVCSAWCIVGNFWHG